MRRNVQEMEERVKTVSFQSRDTRMVGCTGRRADSYQQRRARKADYQSR
jgi:hypothetical protein